MKILNIVQDYFPHIGGTSLRIYNLYQPLIKKYNCEIHILVPKNGKKLKNYEVLDNIYVHRVKNYYIIPLAVRAILKKYKIDLICTHNPRPTFFAHLSFIKNIPFILEVHTISQLSILKEFLNRFNYLRADKIITLSKSSRNFIVENYHVVPNNVEIVYNGYNFKTKYDKERIFYIKQKYDLDNDDLIVGYIGTFHDFQGVEYFVKSLPYIKKNYKKIKTLIVGNGPLNVYLKNLAKSLKISKEIIFTGTVLLNDIQYYYKLIDIFVIPRPSMLATETAIPLKLIEAMAMEKTILATNVGGLSEILENGKNALLVNPGDEIAIAKGIMTLISDKELRKKLAKNAFNTSINFKWENSSHKLFEIYKNLLTYKKYK